MKFEEKSWFKKRLANEGGWESLPKCRSCRVAAAYEMLLKRAISPHRENIQPIADMI